MISYLREKTFFVLAVLLMVVGQFCCPSLFARQTNVNQVKKAVRGWLAADSKPLGLKLGKTINKVDSFTDDSGSIIYYVVYLDRSGFVIVSGDDLVEPIIAFVSKGSYEPSVSNPLGALVIGDIPNRIKAARNLEDSVKTNKKGRSHFNNITALEKASLKAKDKWSKFSSYESDELVLASASSISDVWVEPFVTSTWSQTTIGSYIGGTSCYNYYTPPYSAGSSDNYPCGCVATAMAQVIRYYEHQPAGGVGWPYLGGNGSGGSYIWSNMPLQPAVGTTTVTECQAIGALCYDTAESIDTTYGPGGSSASVHNAQLRFEDTFGYSNCIYYDNSPSNIPASSRVTMINPNIDAGYPVILGIRGSSGGHAVVCDGYGYNASTLYHHLNMGWSGTSDAWYNLPVIDAAINFDTVDTCVYNVFTSGSGEIISGRVANLAGEPLSGVDITATGGGTHNTTTNDKGVYALTHVPSNTSFTLTASKVGWSFSVAGTSTGQSTDYSATAGNKWGINFTGSVAISAGTVEFDKEIYLPGETIIITLTDSDLAGNGFQNVLVTTSGGDQETISLSESPVGSGIFAYSIATAQASVVTEDGIIQVSNNETITVTYNDADDGTGNPATVQDTANTPSILLDADFTGGLPGGWSIIDGGSSSHTWTSTNPGGRSNANWNGTFMIVDSDYAGNQNMDEQLITPNLDCSSTEGVTLKFSHYFRYYWDSPDEIGNVGVRVNSGPWQNVASYQGADTSGQVELDISAIADGQENVQIRWHYYNAYWDYYWGIDNVEVAGIQTAGLFPNASGGGSEYISRVQVGDIDNSSGENGYADYTALSTTMNIGTGYPITVTNGSPYLEQDKCGGWVDWNQDYDFDDAGETISMAVIPGPGPYTATITPPADAKNTGDTRMRIRIRWGGEDGSNPLEPDGHTNYGEVEDYTINVAGGIAPSEIRGTKFFDVNSNGIFDDGEPGLEGWTIYLDSNDNGKFDIGEPNTITDSNGDYEFVGLAAGTYTVAEVLQDGWKQTGPSLSGEELGLISVSNPRDLVFDSQRNLLYISTTSGTVERYDLLTEALLSPLVVGTNANRMDITPDCSTLYLTETTTSGGQGFLHKVNLNNGFVTDIAYNLTFGESGSWDVSIGSDGKGLMTTRYSGSGWVPLRELDVATDTLTIRTDIPGSHPGNEIRQDTRIFRSADRTLLFLLEGNSSAGPMFTYNASTDTFGVFDEVSTFLDHIPGGVNNDGSLLAYQPYNGSIRILNDSLSSVTSLGTGDGGFIFDSIRNVLYVADSDADQIVAIDTQYWNELFRMDIGENIARYSIYENRGYMAISDNGQFLALSTSSGVRLFQINGTSYIITLANGDIADDINFGNITGDISAEVNLDNFWMYQNLPGQSGSDLTATVSITDDILSNSSYTYEWELIVPADVTIEPSTVNGGATADTFFSFAACSCNETGGLSDSGQPFKVRVTVTGNDYGNTGAAEAEFGIAILGDINNDGVVNVADRSITNAFWRTGSAGVFTLRDCDVNCDGVINVADRSIANAIWRGTLGQNSVSSPCPFR